MLCKYAADDNRLACKLVRRFCQLFFAESHLQSEGCQTVNDMFVDVIVEVSHHALGNDLSDAVHLHELFH